METLKEKIEYCYTVGRCLIPPPHSVILKKNEVEISGAKKKQEMFEWTGQRV